MIFAYRLVWLLASFIITTLTSIILKIHRFRRPLAPTPKWLRALVDRESLSLRQICRPNPLWIHCASGEFEYVRTFIRLQKAKYPLIPILLTYSSPSLGDWLAQNSSILEVRDIDVICPLPFDKKNHVTMFLKFYNPRCLLISRTDLWPEFLYQMKSMNKPTFLIAATLDVGQKKMNPLFRTYVRWNLSLLSEVWAVTEKDASNFQKLISSQPLAQPSSQPSSRRLSQPSSQPARSTLAPKIKVSGEPRIDQALYRINNPSKKFMSYSSFFKNSKSRYKIIFASTWPEDHGQLENSLRALKDNGQKFIWAPHEVSITSLELIESQLQKSLISYKRLSKITDTKNVGEGGEAGEINGDTEHSCQCLVIDQVGVLADIYPFCEVAFVGGSFKAQVHSVLEPLAAGNRVIVGPHFRNSREAIDFNQKYFEGAPAVTTVNSGVEIAQALLQLRPAAESIRNEVQSLSGASARMVNWLKQMGLT